MLGRLVLLLALVPLAELWLLMELAQRTSLLMTIAVVLTTGVVGISLVRWQGINTARTIQRQLASGQSPSRSMVSGVLLLVAGALLLTPGLLTDTVGFLLLVPWIRTAIAIYMEKRFVAGISTKFRSSVWVHSSSSGWRTAEDEPLNESERPHVVVVEPEQRAIDD